MDQNSTFDIWVVFLAIFLASVGALNPDIFKSVAPGTHRQKAEKRLTIEDLRKRGVKKLAEANQEQEVFTFNVVTSFFMTGFLSGGDVATPPKSLVKLLEKHNLNLNMPSEEAKQLTKTA